MLPRREKDDDTDPSTPDAMRREDTDPGIGPPIPGLARTQRMDGAPAQPQPLPPLTPPPPPPSNPHGLGPQVYAVPQALAVPVTQSTGPKKDSVELLLDGMTSPQNAPPRTAPQSDGSGSAAYHAEHALRPAHTEPGDDEPKVVVQRPVQAATVRLDRQMIDAIAEAVDAKREAEEEEGLEEKTLPMSLRVAIAAVAGLAVVLAIFLVTKAMGSGDDAAPTRAGATTPPVPTAAPPPTIATTATSVPAASAAPPDVPAPAPTPTEEPTTPPPVVAATALPTAPTATATANPTATAKPKPRPSATGTDTGEFKTTFH